MAGTSVLQATTMSGHPDEEEQSLWDTTLLLNGRHAQQKLTNGANHSTLRRPLSPSQAPKILLYSHDTAGLGNIRRTLLLAESLRQQFDQASILIITGSPVIHGFHIPERVDYIKLPCLDRVESRTYEPRFLHRWPDEVNAMRQSILLRTVANFQPDLMIVDKRPGGVDNELIPVLEQLHSLTNRPRLVVGVRDILDAPEKTRPALIQDRSFDLIDRYYDEVWIYGSQFLFNHTNEYAYPQSVRQKTHYCGYLRRPTETLPRKNSKPKVLLTTGGGGDGADVVEAYLEGLTDLPRRVALRTKVIFGPQMPDKQRKALLKKYGHLADVKFRKFKSDLTRAYARADIVVSMAGYNTICELLSCQKRAVLVPREAPVQEQLIRARRLADLGYFNLIERSRLTPESLMVSVMNALEQDPPDASLINMDGLDVVGQRAAALLGVAIHE